MLSLSHIVAKISCMDSKGRVIDVSYLGNSMRATGKIDSEDSLLEGVSFVDWDSVSNTITNQLKLFD